MAWRDSRKSRRRLLMFSASIMAGIAALVAIAMIPRTDDAPANIAVNGDITTLDLMEIADPDDYAVLTSAGWPFDNGFLTAGL